MQKESLSVSAVQRHDNIMLIQHKHSTALKEKHLLWIVGITYYFILNTLIYCSKAVKNLLMWFRKYRKVIKSYLWTFSFSPLINCVDKIIYICILEFQLHRFTVTCKDFPTLLLCFIFFHIRSGRINRYHKQYFKDV